jgi:hypothetical protein
MVIDGNIITLSKKEVEEIVKGIDKAIGEIEKEI